jgi:Fungal specific transcription factor domain
VHLVCPVIHQRRYFAWAGQESLPPTRACLRSAMRTMAAAVSPRYRRLGDVLYAETRRLLETHVEKPTSEVAARVMASDKIPLEQIQAWLLLAHYESLRMEERQAMLTAGRAFRLVQMARLYDVDTPDNVPPVTAEPELDESFVDAEEKRRTFWLAYSFDRFLCWRNEWPLTLQEEMASLPTLICVLVALFKG